MMNPLRLVATAALVSTMLTGCQSTDFDDWRETSSMQAFATSVGPVTRTEMTSENQHAVQHLRTYTDTAGCTVYMGRVSPKGETDQAQTAAQYHLPGEAGVIRSYHADTGSWSLASIGEQITLEKGMYFVRTDRAEAIIVTPLTYTSHANGMIEYLTDADGTLSIQADRDGYTLSLSVDALPTDSYSDFLVLCADEPLIDWESTAAFARWSNYRFTDSNRWCYDGYYYTSPSTYYPTGEDYFYPLPAAHIAGKMARNAGDPASRALGLAMIDIMREKQNEYGFIPSQAGSEWLKEDYNIDPGYYDTRFNTDFWLANLNAARNFGVTEWLDKVEKYAVFLMDFGADHHFSFGTGREEGWLIEDYWHPNGAGNVTHCSLNHHAAEASFLYQLTEVTGNQTYAVFADRMVRGIELTAELWPMEDGNLYYAYLPDGTMMTGDYPSLTYNDLIDLQALYARRHGGESPAIRSLLETKRGWMENNGITDYSKAPTV